MQEAVKNVETYVEEKLGERWNIPKTAVNPFPIRYEPTKDVTPKLELWRIYINTEISMLASHLPLSLQREGHLEAVFHVFLYLLERHNLRLALDQTYPEIYHDRFRKHK